MNKYYFKTKTKISETSPTFSDYNNLCLKAINIKKNIYILKDPFLYKRSRSVIRLSEGSDTDWALY